MKKQTKLIALIVCLILLVGIVSVVVFAETAPADQATMLETHTGLSATMQDTGMIANTKVKSNNNNNGNLQFTMISHNQGVIDGKANPYVQLGAGWGQFTDANVANTRFVTMDLDICTGSTYIPIYSQWIDFTTTGGTRWVDKAIIKLSPDGVVTSTINGEPSRKELGTNPYEWHHWFIIYDLELNVRAAYIDGDLVELEPFFTLAGKDTIKLIKGMRWEFPRQKINPEGGSICIANTTQQIYSKDSPLDVYTDPTFVDVGANIKDLILETDHLIYGPNYPVYEKENFYEVNGEGKVDFNAAVALANGGTVKILMSRNNVVHKIESDITIDRNNCDFKYEAAGFEVVENGQLLTFTKTNAKSNIKIYDGETLLSEQTLEMGAKIDTSKVPGSKKADGKTFAFRGYSLKPDGTDIITDLPVANGDAVYYTVYVEAACIVTTGSGNVTVYGDNETLKNIIGSASVGSVIKLYKDYSINGNVQLRKDVTVDLNGFTLTMENDRFSASGAKNLTFTNGTIFTAKGKNFIYIDESQKDDLKFTLDKCTISGDSTFVDSRKGNTLITNCVFNLITSRAPLSGGYRGPGHKVTVENTVFNSTAGTYALYDQGRASNETKPFNCDIVFRGVTYNGHLDAIVKIGNSTAGAKDAYFNCTIEGDCIFNTDTAVTVNQIEKNGIVIQNGAQFKSLKVNGIAKVTYGDGTSVLASNGKFIEVAPKANVATVTFKANGVEVPADYIKGTIPTLPSGDGYEFITKTPLTPVDKDVAYEGTVVYEPYLILQNLTLHIGFNYNIYVEAVGGIKSITVGKTVITDLSKLAQWNGCYVVTKADVLPIDIAEDMAVTVVRTSPFGDVEDKYTVNMVDYAVYILNNNFSKEAKTLMADTLRYVKETYRTYSRITEPGYKKLKASEELFTKYASKVNVPATDASMAAVADSVKSARLNLNTTTRFRFELAPTFSGTIVVEYTADGAPVKQEYTATDGKIGEVGYFEVDLRAYDLTGDIKITVGEKVGTYNLAAYYASLNVQELTGYAYAYSMSAAAYKAVITK